MKTKPKKQAGEWLARAAIGVAERLATPAKRNMKTRVGVVHAPGEREEVWGGSHYRPLCDVDTKYLTLKPTRDAVTCQRCERKLAEPAS